MRDREELQPNCPLSQRMFSSAPLKLLALLGTMSRYRSRVIFLLQIPEKIKIQKCDLIALIVKIV